MLRRTKGLPESFHEKNRRLKREMLTVGFWRPNRRLMSYCFAAGIICAALCIAAIILGYDNASFVLLIIAFGIGIIMFAIQQSSRLSVFVQRRLDRDRSVRSDDND